MEIYNRDIIVESKTSYEEVFDRVKHQREFYRKSYDTLKFKGDVNEKVLTLLKDSIQCRTIHIEKSNLEGMVFANKPYLNHYWIFEKCNLGTLKIDNISYTQKLKLYKCKVDKLTITNSKLVECNFSELIHNELKIQNSSFEKCYFRTINLSRLDFVVNNIQFDTCSFINADLSETKWKEGTDNYFVKHKFNKANLTNANFNGINLIGSTFKLATLVDTDFSGSNLYQCNFDNTTLKDCNLSRTNCNMTCFNHSTLKNCNLSQASINWANFKNTKLIDTYLNTAYYTLTEKSTKHFACSTVDLIKLYKSNDQN